MTVEADGRYCVGTLLVIVPHPPLAAQRRGREGRIEKRAYNTNSPDSKVLACRCVVYVPRPV